MNSDEEFFVLLPATGSAADTDYVPADPIYLEEAPRCPKCGSFIGSKDWLAPYHAEIEIQGDVAGDFAFFGSKFLMSERGRHIYEAAGVTGLSDFERVGIARITPNKIKVPNYYHLGIARSNAVVDLNRSGLFPRLGGLRNFCSQCLEPRIIDAIDGIVIREGTWSGEDIFYARGLPGTILVTSAFREVITRAQLTNVRFVRSEDFAWPEQRSFRAGFQEA